MNSNYAPTQIEVWASLDQEIFDFSRFVVDKQGFDPA
jgi:hypothetical protein